MKKILFIFSFLVILINASAQTTFTQGSLTYITTGTNTVSVVASNSKITGTIIIPSTVIDNSVTYSVTSIGDYAFQSCLNITSITIPSSVISIGSGAFWYCYGLTTITIPSSVTLIADWAFKYLNALIIVDTNNTMYSSKDGVLYNKAFTTLINCPLSIKGEFVIPSTVTTISPSAFGYCNYLTSVTIPSSVTSIVDWAFADCSALIIVDTNNSKFSSKDGVLYSKDFTTLIQYPTSLSGSFIIPSSVISIGSLAFYMCHNLTSVIMPNSLKTICWDAFIYCDGLTSVSIGNSVTSIEGGAFDGCKSLTSIAIPSSVTSIGNTAFNGCTGLTYFSVATSNSMYSSKDGVLYNKDFTTLNCYPAALKGVFTVPSSVTLIGSFAFVCSGLSSIIIPSSVTSIGDYAFESSTNFTSITIPSSVTSIGGGAFYGCSNLNSLKVGCITPPTLDAGFVFYNVPITTCKLIVPYGSLNAYKAAPQWQDFTNISESIGIATLNATAITGTTVTTGGRIDNDGGYPILSRGICWATTANPTTNNGIISNGTTGTGSYSLIIAGLAPNTTYHLRAYATNITGTYYGDDISFTTQISTAVKNNYFGNSNTYFNPGNRKIVFGPGDTSTTQFTLQLYNLAGRKIYSSVLSGAEVELYLSSLQLKGIYLLQLLDNKGLIVVNQKIILNREQ